jgi:hypothetical protein
VRKNAWALAVVAAVLATGVPAVHPEHAAAHQGNPDFRSELNGIEPSVPGLEAEILNYDDSLQLRNDSGEDVVVEGYEGEPYIRILADGTVQVNTRSPAHYLNDDRFGNVEPPRQADASAPPEWETVDRTGQYAWHDHRVHYMGQGTPEQVRDEGERTEVFDYEVPIEAGGEPAAVTGTLVWVGKDDGFPVAPFAGLGAAALVIGGLLLLRRRRGEGGPESGEAGEAW